MQYSALLGRSKCVGAGNLDRIHRPHRTPAVYCRCQHRQIVHGIAEDHVLLRFDPIGIAEFLHRASLIDTASIKIDEYEARRRNGKDLLERIQIRVAKMRIRSVRIYKTQFCDRNSQCFHVNHALNLNADPRNKIQICLIRAFRIGF